jgi:RHS repeat-associated protein
MLPSETIVKNMVVHPFNGLTSYDAGNGLSTTKVHDLAGRMTQLKTEGVHQMDYGYGVGPRIQQIRQPSSLPLNSVDKQNSNQLPNQISNVVKTDFQYKSFSGLATTSDQIKVIKIASNVMRTPKIASTYDKLGRTVNDDRYRYTYTSSGQIATIADVTTKQPIATYAYNSQHQRVRKTVLLKGKERTTHYLWQANRLVAEVNEQGQISSQYLYLNEGQAATPIAKLESKHNLDNNTGNERTLYIHTDYRATPLAMTDATKRVVWHSDLTPWGLQKTALNTKPSIDSNTSMKLEAMLNIRLPGQYYDAETGLHDNLHRTYNPNTGRYLQPDPLGYPDGPDAYLYAAGDPINKVDPLGLYQEDTHYYTTFFLAIAAGVNYKAALTMALAAQYIDDNKFTSPLSTVGLVSGHRQRLLTYHFALVDSNVGANGLIDPWSNGPDPTDTNYANPISFQLENLLNASQNAPTPCARFQFYGEYLHTFEDTFSHRDRTNRPYDLNWGLGHGHEGSNPDYTYDDKVQTNISWNVRSARTLQMQSEVFEKLTGFSGGDGSAARSWSEVEVVMKAFNAIEEDEEHGGGKNFTQKRATLQAALSNWGINVRDVNGVRKTFDLTLDDLKYEKGKGEKERLANLCDKQGLRLKQSDYPGTILPIEACA